MKKSVKKLLIEISIVITIIFLLSRIALPVYKEKINRVRFNYALSELLDKQKPLVDDYYKEHKRLPASASKISSSTEIRFPDGGGTRIEENGIIHLWFDVIPELKEASIYLVPTVKNDNKGSLSWRCDVSGKEKERIEKYFGNTCKYLNR
ncbi:MAG: hypothetical protein HQL46_14460 [Gammaproteobacteria bacterium]|nr:hypothetical protein [Gammaproteobacteria bacterium]